MTDPMTREAIRHNGVSLSFADSPSSETELIATVRFEETGEEREQTVDRNKAYRVKEATVRNRIDRQGSGATPHTLIG